MTHSCEDPRTSGTLQICGKFEPCYRIFWIPLLSFKFNIFLLVNVIIKKITVCILYILLHLPCCIQQLPAPPFRPSQSLPPPCIPSDCALGLLEKINKIYMRWFVFSSSSTPAFFFCLFFIAAAKCSARTSFFSAAATTYICLRKIKRGEKFVCSSLF